MKFSLMAFSLLLALTSFSSFALEVGDTAPCVVLKHVKANGSDEKHCIRDPHSEGQLKVLEFFSATCSACAKNLPKFSKLEEEFGEDVTFRLVGVDESESLLRNYINTKKALINVDVALDTKRHAMEAYDVFATPTLFVLDQNDVVLYKHIGVLKSSDIRELKEIFETR